MSQESLSEREREILRLVAIGATNQRIANELSISINTVKVHVHNIFAKIGAGSRAEAALHAARIGLIPGAEGPDSSSQQAIALPVFSAGVDETPVVAQRADAEWTSNLRQNKSLLVGSLIVLLIVIVTLSFGPLASTFFPSSTPLVTPGSVIALQRWRVLADLPGARAGFAVSSLSVEGKPFVYIVGGDNGSETFDEVLRYDPAADLWVRLSAKPTPVSDVRAAVVGNRFYVVGGRLPSGEPTAHVEAYDPQHDRWTTLAPLPAPRAGHAVAAVDGKVYVIGGWDGAQFCTDVWQYNPDDDTWRSLSPMPTPRAYAAAATVDGRIHVIGGEGDIGALTVNERYSPADEDGTSRPWSTKAPLPKPAPRVDAATAGGYVIVAGIEDAQGELAIYTPQSDSWRASAVPLQSVYDLRLQAIGSKLYLLGGRHEGEPVSGAFEYQVISTIFLPAVQ